MKVVLSILALFLSFVAGATAQNATPPPFGQTWKEIDAEKGLVPYHQLTVDDFQVNDNAASESFWIKPFIRPRYQFSTHVGGLFYAYVSNWMVSSGLDKNQSWRKGSLEEMKNALPYAQAILDLTEVCARQLTALKTGELPRGSGPTADAAMLDLTGKMNVFLNQKYEKLQIERDEFAKATNHGQNKKKVRELAAAIRKRLDAIPSPSQLPVAGASVPTSTASASASSSPK
jgi:hypothetical protein